MTTWHQHEPDKWVTEDGLARVRLGGKGRRLPWTSELWLCRKWARLGIHENVITAKRMAEDSLRIRKMEIQS